jgi:pimeloyl-ACP methyl ester carboxylesterase
VNGGVARRVDAAAVVALLDELQIARAHVHGHGAGGTAVVAQLLATAAERLRSASVGGAALDDLDAGAIARAGVPLLAVTVASTEGRRGASGAASSAEVGGDSARAQDAARALREIPTFWSYALPAASRVEPPGAVYAHLVTSFVDLYHPDAPAPREGRFEATDGVALHYWTMGEGTPVVLLHGFTGSADMWLLNGVAAALRDRHQVLALDCRGHGLSEKPHDPARYGLRIAEDVIELLDHVGAEKAHVHGFSLGGWILAQLLARHPERIESATFSGHGVLEEDPELVARVPPDLVGLDARDREAREAARDPLELEARSVRGPRARDAEALAAARAYPWKATERLEGEIFPSRLPIDLARIEAPVLALVGALDFPNLKTHRMWRKLRDFAIVRLPGRGHVSAVAPGYIAPEYVAATVRFVDANDRLSRKRGTPR